MFSKTRNFDYLDPLLCVASIAVAWYNQHNFFQRKALQETIQGAESVTYSPPQLQQKYLEMQKNSQENNAENLVDEQDCKKSPYIKIHAQIIAPPAPYELLSPQKAFAQKAAILQYQVERHYKTTSRGRRGSRTSHKTATLCDYYIIGPTFLGSEEQLQEGDAGPSTPVRLISVPSQAIFQPQLTNISSETVYSKPAIPSLRAYTDAVTSKESLPLVNARIRSEASSFTGTTKNYTITHRGLFVGTRLFILGALKMDPKTNHLVIDDVQLVSQGTEEEAQANVSRYKMLNLALAVVCYAVAMVFAKRTFI